ncbi:MAG: zinc ribbon domain-containing protein [Euryarchaeota archaeon]
MPYCQNCGTKNDEGVEFCINCHNPLYDTRRRRARRDGCYGDEGPEQECFGLPHGGIIVGIIFGLLLLIAGVILILQKVFGIAINFNGELVWPVVMIAIAVLIIAGAIYQIRRRSQK